MQIRITEWNNIILMCVTFFTTELAIAKALGVVNTLNLSLLLAIKYKFEGPNKFLTVIGVSFSFSLLF